MSFITRMVAAVVDAPLGIQPGLEGWREGALAVSGVPVNAETALKLSTWWACDRLICETVASLPALVYERLADGGRQRATSHPLYDVLHTRPNDYQTPIEFFDFMTHSAAARGNAFARIVAGPRGFADQLKPVHPDYVRMERLSDNRLRYRVSEPGRPVEVLSDEQMLHLKGMSADGVTGASVVGYARDSVGLGLAAERYGARFFRNNAEPRGVLKSQTKLSPEAAKRVKTSWDSAHGGENQGRIAVLEEGLDYQAISLNNKDSQFLESRMFQAEDICRWWRVPPHMVGLTSKVTSWGSGIEQLGQGFVTYTLMPWLVRWQQAISRDLILAPQKYFVEFATEALLRGDLKGRYDAYAIALDKGFMNPNEVRQRENLNPRPGGEAFAGTGEPLAAAPTAGGAGGSDFGMADSGEDVGTDDERLRLQADAAGILVRAGYKQKDAARVVGLPPMEDWGSPPVTIQSRAALESAPTEKDKAAAASSDHYAHLVNLAAARVVRKEVAALAKAAGRGGDWATAVSEFYAAHAGFVEQALGLTPEQAQTYAEVAAVEVAAAGPELLAQIEEQRVAKLAALVLEGNEP